MTPRELTPEAFAKFLLWLSDDPDTAAREYEKIRKKMVRYFTLKGCDDPDTLFDKTIDQAARTHDSTDDYPTPLALCYGVAKNIWREDCRKRKPDPLPDDDLLAVPESETEEREQEAKCLETCLSRLSAGSRNLITRYYQGHGREKIEARKQLAAAHGGENTLRIKAFRIRGKLRVCVDECIQRLP